ncbi:MGMT family protein [Wenzhouxiangella sediminis]|uniref:Cysteine methyltransferase n=1 Tax=Wenzhouxiangella sediminis TaxID=1792836 RepID=A0A3E1KA56_9GAMM|nr:MGMT family protein [Wenzhouxiangella sediminis]RFF31195.1 cysteine methyltransferase [Wenzhouxiangella sediminis]
MSEKTKATADPAGEDDRYQRIWEAVAGIPTGCVLNYGEVARRAGLPGKARLVGRALGLAPKKMALPWHRVVNAQGRISFPEDSRKAAEQRRRLEEEGVEFEGGSIDLDRFSPERALDRMLWGPG